MTISVDGVLANANIRELQEAVVALQAAPGGGGGPIVRKFSFAYNTPGLLTGHAIYTPTIGDLLLNAWIEVVTPWDGTTPRGDIGVFVNYTTGLFYFQSSLWVVPMDYEIFEYDVGLTHLDSLADLYQNATAGSVVGALQVPAIESTPEPQQYLTTLPATTGDPCLPLRFTQANPLKVVVSQDGKSDGADPGSTQGEAFLYLITVTPV